MRLLVSESTEIETFATDGKRLLVNPKFCASLSDKEVVTVLAHEVLHCALGHIWRTPAGADRKIWNMAVDNEVNWELEAANIEAGKHSASNPFPFPACGACMEDRFKDMAAEKVYRVLAEEKTDQPEDQQADDQSGQGQGQGKGSGKGKGKGQGKEPGQGQGQNGFGEILPIPQDEKDKTQQDWERALVQAANLGKGRGFVPAKVKELVAEVTSTKIDWRALLRDFISTFAKEDWSFSRSNTRFESTGFFMPSLHNEKPGHIVFAIDTSGSISSELLADYVAEAQLALDNLSPEKLTLIYCDAEVQAVKEYQPGDKIELETFGRGGTDFCPVFEHFNKADELPKVLVYLTDLDGSFPQEAPEFPVLWVTDSKGHDVPFGEVIEV
jgi:predicted metal-dependent peptidase